MRGINHFLSDIRSNKQNLKGVIFICLFRLSGFFANSGTVLRIIGFPIRLCYKVFIRWILGIDIPDITKIGYGFMVYHGQGLIIHGDCIIGNNVLVRHNTTIGLKDINSGVPRIGDNVQIGAHSIIIGDITVGANSIIGAGTFVNKDVPANCIAYGNPFKIKNIK